MASRVDAGNELNSAAALQYRKLCLKKHRCDLLKDKNRSPKSWSFAVAASSQTLVSSGAFLRQWKIWQYVFTLKKNVFLSVFFLLATNSDIWFSRSALSARPTIEPQLHSNVHWRKKKKKKPSTCPLPWGETREELLGLHRPRLNRLLGLTKERLSAKVLRKRSGRWYARRRGSPAARLL